MVAFGGGARAACFRPKLDYAICVFAVPRDLAKRSNAVILALGAKASRLRFIAPCHVTRAWIAPIAAFTPTSDANLAGRTVRVYGTGLRADPLNAKSALALDALGAGLSDLFATGFSANSLINSWVDGADEPRPAFEVIDTFDRLPADTSEGVCIAHEPRARAEVVYITERAALVVCAVTIAKGISVRRVGAAKSVGTKFPSCAVDVAANTSSELSIACGERVRADTLWLQSSVDGGVSI